MLAIEARPTASAFRPVAKTPHISISSDGWMEDRTHPSRTVGYWIDGVGTDDNGLFVSLADGQLWELSPSREWQPSGTGPFQNFYETASDDATDMLRFWVNRNR